jgi:hypothetical protein
MFTGAHELFDVANKYNLSFPVTMMNNDAKVDSIIIAIAPYLIFANTLDVTSVSFEDFLDLSKEQKAITNVVSAAFKRYERGQMEQGFALAVKNHYNTAIYPSFKSVENSDQRFFSFKDNKPSLWMMQAMLFGSGPCQKENMKKAFTKGTKELFVFLKQIITDYVSNPVKINALLTQIIESHLPINEYQTNLLADYFVEANIDSVDNRLFLLQKELEDYWFDLIIKGIYNFIWPVGNLAGIAACPVKKLFQVMAIAFAAVLNRIDNTIKKRLAIIVTNAPVKEAYGKNAKFFAKLAGQESSQFSTETDKCNTLPLEVQEIKEKSSDNLIKSTIALPQPLQRTKTIV